jgi:cobalt/nickel transport system permease protein
MLGNISFGEKGVCMHIPDGYLGPQTYGVLYGIMVPLWALASKLVRRTLRQRQVPFLALGAAFSFVVMMFNVPIPGGSTGHAVGGVIVAILLGPWAALIAISIALVIQALLFGDGGITAIAANCFNMAFVMPMVGYWVYRLIGQGAPATSRRKWIAGAVAGYVGLNVAALTTAVMFGIQPFLARGPDGRPLYFPYPLEVAVPVMAAQHLLLFGFIEAVLTALLVIYFQRSDPSMLEPIRRIQ